MNRLRTQHYLAFFLSAFAVLCASPAAHAFGGGGLAAWNEPYDRGTITDASGLITSDLAGRQITITGGAGFIPGTYTVSYVALNADATAQGQGHVNLVKLVPDCTNLQSAHAGMWYYNAPSSGPPYTLPTATPRPAVTGAVPVLQIGDSLTVYGGAYLLPALQAVLPNAQVSLIAHGESGSGTGSWYVGSPRLAAAIQDGAQNGAVVCTVMLGVNDSAAAIRMPVATYVSNLTAMVAALRAGIPTLRFVILQDPTYVDPGAGNGTFPLDVDTELAAYGNSLGRVPGAKPGDLLDYAFTASDRSMSIDGIHYVQVGYTGLARLHADSIAAALAAGPHAGVSVSPDNGGVNPNATLHLTVSGLPAGVTVSSWSVAAPAPTGVSISSAGTVSYGAALPADTKFTVQALLSSGLALTGTETAWRTFHSSNASLLDASAFTGTLTNTGTYVLAMIGLYAKVAILISMAIGGVMLLWRWSRKATGH